MNLPCRKHPLRRSVCITWLSRDIRTAAWTSSAWVAGQIRHPVRCCGSVTDGFRAGRLRQTRLNHQSYRRHGGLQAMRMPTSRVVGAAWKLQPLRVETANRAIRVVDWYRCNKTRRPHPPVAITLAVTEDGRLIFHSRKLASRPSVHGVVTRLARTGRGN